MTASAAKFGVTPSVQRAGRLLTPEEASEYLGIPQKTLANWRSERRGPQFVKLESRLIRYRLVDLENYVSSKIVSTEVDTEHA